MYNRNIFPSSSFQWLFLFLMSLSSQAQNLLCDATTLQDFYNCYGGQSVFTPHSVAALTTFIEAENAIKAGDYGNAKKLIDNLFKTYPRGANIWWNVFNDPNGANIGTPHAYYGLRMLEDIIDYSTNGDPNVKAKKANMKVVLVGCSEGIQPNSETDLLNGTGTFVNHNIDAKIKENDHRIIKQSLDMFLRYVTAITKGKLQIEVEIIELDTLCLPVTVTTSKPHLAYKTIEPVWDALTDEVKKNTDWWWILYPSHVPESPTFNDEAFITGGMGSDSKGGPVFIIDDKWIVRKPAHLGKGNYSDIERRIYLPQWLQHEFFHHLYRIYPELALEVNGHDWFDRNFWPSDFEGQFESDYYAETLHKRLQINCAPLEAKLITRVHDNLEAQYGTMTMDELLGTYSLDVIQNPWHEGSIIQENGEYFWKNTANVKWKVTTNLIDGILKTGTDSPYPGKDFFIELYKTQEGDFVAGAVALKFQGDYYKKRFNLLRTSIPIEIALGQFERVPNLNTQHTGYIIKTSGKLFWQNNAGGNWSLTPNTMDEYFGLNSDSPTPNEKFELILIDNECETYALGFKYLDHYYWKPKKSLSNQSPILKNGIADLELEKNFGSYSINLSEVFEDETQDSLLLFATSELSTFISTDIDDQELRLSGGEIGSTTIFVMALDANGGIAVDEFEVQVKTKVSTNEALSNISVFPNLTQDFIYVNGAIENRVISLTSVDQSFHQSIAITSDHKKIDLSHLPTGMYFLRISDPSNKTTKIEKIFKY